MNQTDKGPEGNEEVCSTTEVRHAEKNVLISRGILLHVGAKILLVKLRARMIKRGNEICKFKI